MTSMFTDPLFCLKRSSRLRMRTKTAVDLLTLSEIGWGWEKYTDVFFLFLFRAQPLFLRSVHSIALSFCSSVRRFSNRKREQRLFAG